MSTTVASVAKHFPSAQNGFTTTLASSISSGAATVPLNSVAGYSNGEVAVFIVDPADASKKQTFTGVVDTSGVQVTGVVWTAGTNQSHSAGATVVDYAAATHISMITKGLLVEHLQTGVHALTSNSTITSSKVITGLNDTNGNELFKVSATTSAVNELTVANAATGNSPILSATGGDTNIDIRLAGKGTGRAMTDYLPPQTFVDESSFDYVASGGVWSGDSYGSTRAASMTALVCYINGRRISIGAVTARTFTASKDTYIDVLDNADGTGTLVYTEVANNAASPALASDSIRIGIIITAAGSIANIGSVNQGQEDKLLPITSSTPYSVTDSLGNLICNRNPYPSVIGYRQTSTSNQTGITTIVDITGLSVPVIVPTGRKIQITIFGHIYSSINADIAELSIKESAAVIKSGRYYINSSTSQACPLLSVITPTAGSHTYKATVVRTIGTGTMQVDNNVSIGFIKVELV